ncbi:protein of unknown function [Nitratireductor aquimarinus]
MMPSPQSAVRPFGRTKDALTY